MTHAPVNDPLTVDGRSIAACRGPRLAIQFGDAIVDRVRRRIEYSFRVFCAIYGYSVVDDGTESDAVFSYGAETNDANHVALAARYRTEAVARPEWTPCGSRLLPCFFRSDGGSADWLGEAFYWISGESECNILERDSVNRIPFGSTVHHKHQLDPNVPYAAYAFQALNATLKGSLKAGWLCRPTKPWSGPGQCIIAATHDVDFLPLTAWDALYRSLKNALIAGISYHDVQLAATILWTTIRKSARGKRPLNALPELILKEQRSDIRSTYNILCRQANRRDANYSIDDESSLGFVRDLDRDGFEIGLHGSYTSLLHPDRLAEEYERLAQAGWPALGGRQHWLRYQGAELFAALEKANVLYDSTVGYSCRLGFRSGACFPYPPYNFESESPFPFLELPLVMMDSAVYLQHKERNSAADNCRSVLATVRELGWGGVSILWHDTAFGGGQFPNWIGDLYWTLRDKELWRSAGEVAQIASRRFSEVGLLPSKPTKLAA